MRVKIFSKKQKITIVLKNDGKAPKIVGFGIVFTFSRSALTNTNKYF